MKSEYLEYNCSSPIFLHTWDLLTLRSPKLHPNVESALLMCAVDRQKLTCAHWLSSRNAGRSAVPLMFGGGVFGKGLLREAAGCTSSMGWRQVAISMLTERSMGIPRGMLTRFVASKPYNRTPVLHARRLPNHAATSHGRAGQTTRRSWGAPDSSVNSLEEFTSSMVRHPDEHIYYTNGDLTIRMLPDEIASSRLPRSKPAKVTTSLKQLRRVDYPSHSLENSVSTQPLRPVAQAPGSFLGHTAARRRIPHFIPRARMTRPTAALPRQQDPQDKVQEQSPQLENWPSNPPLQPVVIAMDYETTQLGIDGNHIVELAVRDISGGPASAMHTLVNPGEAQIIPSAQAVHKITNFMVRRASVPRCVLISFSRVLLSGSGVRLGRPSWPQRQRLL